MRADELIPAALICLIVAWALWRALREHPPSKAELVQALLALACGVLVWFFLGESTDDQHGFQRSWAAFIFGSLGAWLLLKLYFRLRYGKGTKISMD